MQQPQQPSETTEEESIFTEADYNMQGYDKHIRNARIMLYIVAALQLLPLALLPSGITDEAKYIYIGVQLFFVAVFIGLAIWTKYKPFAALLTAMIVLVGIWIVAAIQNPASIFSGIIIKIIVVVLLIIGIRNAREAEELKKTFGK